VEICAMEIVIMVSSSGLGYVVRLARQPISLLL